MRALIDRASLRMGLALSSPWTILLFAFISLTALPQALVELFHGNIDAGVSWFSQNFVQLVALSVLGFLGDQQERAAEVRAQDMHDKIDALYDHMRERDAAHHQKLDAIHAVVAAAGETTVDALG